MLRVSDGFQRAFQQLGLTSCESVVRHFAGKAPPPGGVTVRAAALAMPDGTSVAVWYKQYEYAVPAWKFLARASKARLEFRNYEVLATLGLRAAEPVACGEERDRIGRLRRAFILTCAIPDALMLQDFFARHCCDRRSKALRQLRCGLVRQLAEMTRTIHTANFFHNDLVWRNVLVTAAPPDSPKLWWIDCPRGRFDHWSPLRGRRRVKDIALLDLVGALRCTAGERLGFAKTYLGAERLDAAGRTFVRRVLAYKRRKWPGYRE